MSAIKDLITTWKAELAEIKEQLIVRGDKSNTLEYNLLSCEALRLSCCITDLIETVYEEKKPLLAPPKPEQEEK